MPSRLLKKLPRRGSSHRRDLLARHTYRDMVARRSTCRAKEQDHPALGQTRNAAFGPQGSAHHLRLYLWRHLPSQGQERGARPAPLQHRGNEPAFGRNLLRRRTGSPRRAAARPSRLARLSSACRATQHHAHAIAAQMPRTQPRRECLAVHARQLVIEPHLQILRRHPRSLLRRLEPVRQSTPTHNGYWKERLGSWVNVSENWYNTTLAYFLRERIIGIPNKGFR